MDWFERLTGFRETSYDDTRRRLEVGGGRLRSSANGNPQELLRADDDAAIITPACTSYAGEVPPRNHGAAFHGDLVHLATRHESHPLSVGREGRLGCALRTRQFGRLRLIEPADEQLRGGARGVRQPQAIR